jgi:hypothetical protein
LTTFLFFLKLFSYPLWKVKKNNKKTNTGEGDKGKSSTGPKSTVIHTSVHIFETSKRDNPQYFVDVVKDNYRQTTD